MALGVPCGEGLSTVIPVPSESAKVLGVRRRCGPTAEETEAPASLGEGREFPATIALVAESERKGCPLPTRPPLRDIWSTAVSTAFSSLVTGNSPTSLRASLGTDEVRGTPETAGAAVGKPGVDVQGTRGLL